MFNCCMIVATLCASSAPRSGPQPYSVYIRVGTPAFYLVDEVSQYIEENSISGGTSWPTTKQDLHGGKARADVDMDWSDSN